MTETRISRFINWIIGWGPEDDKMLESINKLYKEYNVRISPQGGISKTSKPEFKEKHMQEIRDFQKRTEHLLNKGEK